MKPSRCILVLAFLFVVPSLLAQDDALPQHLRDRGTGLPTSLFGTYIRKGELLIYPFYEYYLDDDHEYKPAELGYGLDRDFRGKYRAHEGLIFIGYGLSDRLALEFEAAGITATLEKSPDDPSATPARIKESGLGDVQAELRYRLIKETENTPEVFGYFETVFPLQKDRVLIGTQAWEFKTGVGAVKGFPWGTMSVRAALEYSDAHLQLGEYAVEYLKRFSRAWRVYVGVEGTQDEVELIAEAQWHISDRVYLKLNNGFGLTSKATDWAPDIGVMFSVPVSD